jgi:hypothetical protein
LQVWPGFTRGMNMTGPDENETNKPKGDWEPDQEIVYHYSREHRLSKASQAVKDYNNDTSRPSFIRTFTKTKGNIFMLIAIVMASALIIIFNLTSAGGKTSLTLGNNSVTISILEEESILILSISKTVPDGKEAYTGPVDITASPVVSDGERIPVFSHRIFFSANSLETYDIALPFEEGRIIVILQTEYELFSRTLRR